MSTTVIMLATRKGREDIEQLPPGRTEALWGRKRRDGVKKNCLSVVLVAEHIYGLILLPE